MANKMTTYGVADFVCFMMELHLVLVQKQPFDDISMKPDNTLIANRFVACLNRKSKTCSFHPCLAIR